MGNILAKVAATDFSIQWALAVVAYLFQTRKFYDLAGSLTYVLLAQLSLEWGQTYFLRQRIQSWLIMIWALRLGSYLFRRLLIADRRTQFNKCRTSFSALFQAWTMQGLLVFISLLPTLLLNSQKADQPFRIRDYVGLGLWLLGFAIETVADHQKAQFHGDPMNTGQFMKTGLWRISRHPNFFGQILLWVGLYISASTSFSRLEQLSIISPLFTTFLRTKITGIPQLERDALHKWGHDPDYLKYLANTPALIPFVG